MSEKRLSDRAFGMAIGGILGIVALLGWLLTGKVSMWLAALAGSLFSLGLVIPGLLLPLNRLWEKLAHRLGVVSNHLLLGSFFYLVISPFAVVLRLFRRKLMLRKPDPSLATYWTPVGRQATSETYPDMF